MALLLRLVLVVLIGLALALGAPRTAGEEYYLAVRWQQDLTREGIGRTSGRTPVADGVLAAGSDVVAVFSRETGETLYSAVRHFAFAYSDEYFLNQDPAIGGRIAVIDRITESTVFYDRYGIPRLYGSHLVQFDTDLITIQNVGHRGRVVLPDRGELTTFDLVPAEDAPDRSHAVAVTGDLFGTVDVVTIDFADGSYETIKRVTADSNANHAVPVVYATRFVSVDPLLLLKISGYAPQLLEILRPEDGETVLRFEIPEQNTIRSPPAVRQVDSAIWAVAFRDALLFIDVREATVHTVPVEGLVSIAGFMTHFSPAPVVVSAQEDGVRLVVREGISGARRSALWRFPATDLAAVEPDLVILERLGRFSAVEVRR